LVTQEKIKEYISKVPPLPETVKNSLNAVDEGDLPKAASFAKEDLALMSHLKNTVNKPIFGFKKDISDAGQIFGILGVLQAQQLLSSYLVSLLTPKDWSVFTLNNKKFNSLQAGLIYNWNKILSKLGCNDKDVANASILLSSSIIVCEELFKEHKADVDLLREVKQLDYNFILNKLTKKTLFDVATIIGKKWEVSPKTLKIILLSSGKYKSKDKNNDLKYAKFLHLLFFYELSRPDMVEAGLNDFLEFNIDFVGDIYDDFQNIMELEQ